MCHALYSNTKPLFENTRPASDCDFIYNIIALHVLTEEDIFAIQIKPDSS